MWGQVMILTMEGLRQEAHNLALEHDPYLRKHSPKRLRHMVFQDVGKIRDFVDELRGGRSACTQPAEGWLLDHAEFIEEQALAVDDHARTKMLHHLPYLHKSGEARVMAICSEYIRHAGGSLDEESFLSYIHSYQEVSALTIAEVWSIPLMMRIALIRALAGTMDVVKERRELCAKVERILSGMNPERLHPDELNKALEDAGIELPLSGSMTAHLLKHLREWSDDTSSIREWLICKLDNGAESLDRIISYEHQLQADYQVTTGNLIRSLRQLSRTDWNESFEKISVVEQTLRQETTGDYALLDFSSRDTLRRRIERLARRLRVPENLIASQAVQLAAPVNEETPRVEGQERGIDSGARERRSFIAYYLLDAEGIRSLIRALKSCSKPKAMPETGLLRRLPAVYFNGIGVLFVLLLSGAVWWVRAGAGMLPAAGLVTLLVLAPMAMEWAVSIAHWIIGCFGRPVPLLRYDFSSRVPEEASTLVVIPVIWSSTEEVDEMLDRLELHYLANRDENIHFALLGDFKDAPDKCSENDEAVIASAKAGIEALNRTYSGSTFHLFQRSRVWNSSEGVWMGWERKRGKLVEFVELLKGRADTTYETIFGDMAAVKRVKYIITLDADTQLPLGSAQRMIGTMHLPYNRPRLNEAGTRVAQGYGVLQPRIGMSHESALRSRLAYFWSSDPGIDPYAFAVSDPYQDGFGQGIFTGKGIFDVDVFHKVLCERIPDNRVLSHDLLEGGFLRAGLLSDIELIDGHPAAFSAFQKRLHRWVRGDWQLLLWLLPRNKDRKGKSAPVDLSVLTRWQIIDNLRRSLLPPVLLAAIGLSFYASPGATWRLLALTAATMLLPVIRQLLHVRQILSRARAIAGTFVQVFVGFITLPFQSVLLIDAVVRTLYRLTVSKRQLLEWVSSAEVEKRSGRSRGSGMIGMLGGYVAIALFLVVLFYRPNPAVQLAGLITALLWASSPLVIRWLDQPVRLREITVTPEETERFLGLARDIWSFYDDFVTERDHWLPPDNVQIEPPNGVARRTSPTNIGMYMTCAVAARDLGLIDTRGLIERLERTVGTIERMDKWEGHLYNWYNTGTLEPLKPMFVSTVDSGNLVGCLMAVKEGLAEWLSQPIEPGGDPVDPALTKESLQVAFAEEIVPADMPNGLPFQRIRADEPLQNEWQRRGFRLLNRLEALIDGTDFRPLYDHKAKLFSLGYHAERRERDQVLYDLMASEARQSSFVAIALGQVSVSHWGVLGRTMTKAGKNLVMLSWSGTMFEYLMPGLLMNTYPNTVWDSTYKAVVHRQIEYARRRGVPFGISESGYYAYDHQMNYQYRAFGVPGLGFKRGLDQDLVVAPYATIMALPWAKQEAMNDLTMMDELGARGKYGYYEAIDFTRNRMPKDKRHMVIRSFMAHHQGMSLLTLSNMLAKRSMVDRFHRDKRVRSAELLLQERIPARPKIIKHPEMLRSAEPEKKPADHTATREFRSADTRTPELCLLSGGAYTTVVTASGAGFSRFGDVAVTRWREDPVLDPWGSFLYIRDVTRDLVWSPSYQPCRVPSGQQRIRFELEKAVFTRVDEEIETTLEITVSPEWNAEIRRLTLANTGKEIKVMEVTSFQEIALADPIADDAHPAFSKLFINTEYVPEADCMIAKRRPREEKDKTLYAAHSLMVEGQSIGSAEFETDRARFIGRGHSLADPKALRTRLAGTTGSVADPAFVMRRRISIEPGAQAQLFAVTAVAESKEEAAQIVRRFAALPIVDRTFQLAWTRGQIELRHMNLDASDAAEYQKLAGQIVYTPPLRKERRVHISANKKGQSGLWAHGVSGDRPMIAARIEHRSQIDFVRTLVIGHEYLRRLGLMFDLVILNESENGYQQNLQEALQSVIERAVDRHGAGAAGIFAVQANQLSNEDRSLIISNARLVLRANGASLRSQLNVMPADSPLPSRFVPSVPSGRFENRSAPLEGDLTAEPDLLFFNGWGGFTPDGQAYRMTIRRGSQPPGPWVNVLANRSFGCLVSELGTGYSWWRNSRECKLTPWSNDPVLDPPGEACYVRDEQSGETWSPMPAAAAPDQAYEVTHGHGYSKFCHEENGIMQETTVFVPTNDPVKVIQLKLHNRTQEERNLSVTYYAEWLLGVKRQTNASFIVTEWDEQGRTLHARNTFQEVFRDANAFLGVYAEDDSLTGYSCTVDRNEFIGRNGLVQSPAALGRERLSGRTGTSYDACGVVQAKLTLSPGEERVVLILLGCTDSRETSVQLVERYRRRYECETALEQVKGFWRDKLGQISISTPCKEMDVLLNGWLLYQSLCCRMWARTAFFQAGGAYGYRDQLQDSLSLLHTMPELTRAQIVLHAAHQYEEGDVQHWWHEETERGIRTKFSDDLLWLPYAVSRYIVHTGDSTVLDESAPYLRSELLSEEEHERYEETVLSGQSGSVYEHCLRAIDLSLQRIGEHGLPLIGIGDWNDGMNHVGSKGRGESVWLGWFIIDILNRFDGICRGRGDGERADRYRAEAMRLAGALDEHAWDGQWYRRAFTDAGDWLGSVHNEECRIDAIAQSWSVISGAAPEDKAKQAMLSFDRELVDRELSLIRLLTPPFDKTSPSPGYIQGYPPGIRENGAQYTHGVIWGIVALCRLGLGDKAFELFHMLNPISHTRTPNEVRQYTGEPYVMAADIYTADPHKGHAGWTWYTGAAGWMYQAGVEWIMGIQRHGDRLQIRPCIPAEWPEYTVNYRFGQSVYVITVKNPSCKTAGASSLQLDGKDVPAGSDNPSENGVFLELADDGKQHHVVVTM
ncbi:glucoamylase family protein [Paenibacillus tarimensis]